MKATDNNKKTNSFLKSMRGMFATSIVWGKPGSDIFYSHRMYKPLKSTPFIVLQSKVDAIKNEYCKDGIKILNTNLKRLGVIV